MDENYCLYQNGVQLFCQQMTQDKEGNHLPTGKMVPMNVLYKRSILQVYNTVYLYLFCSDDDGKTWNLLTNLNATAKPPEATYFLCGVGRGTILKNGPYKGRILFPCYAGSTTDQFSYCIYSDDGLNWKYSSRVSNITSSEGALLEMPDGSLRFIMRTSLNANGKYLISESYDGGSTWDADNVSFAGFGKSEDEGVGCQISGINYSKKISLPEDKDNEYEAVFVSCPDKRARELGFIYTGILKQDDNGWYNIHWIARKTVTQEKFAYSCLTELPDGRIALLYEKALRKDAAPWEEGLKQIYYSEYDLQELLEDRI